MVVKRKGMQKRTPKQIIRCSGERPSTKQRYKLFALYQWFRGWSIAVFNILKTIL